MYQISVETDIDHGGGKEQRMLTIWDKTDHFPDVVISAGQPFHWTKCC